MYILKTKYCYFLKCSIVFATNLLKVITDKFSQLNQQYLIMIIQSFVVKVVFELYPKEMIQFEIMNSFLPMVVQRNNHKSHSNQQ